MDPYRFKAHKGRGPSIFYRLYCDEEGLARYGEDDAFKMYAEEAMLNLEDTIKRVVDEVVKKIN